MKQYQTNEKHSNVCVCVCVCVCERERERERGGGGNAYVNYSTQTGVFVENFNVKFVYNFTVKGLGSH